MIFFIIFSFVSFFLISFENVSIKFLTDNGFKNFYNNSYAYNTSNNDLRNIKSYCKSNTIICVGGGQYQSNYLLLASCGNCNSILSETSTPCSLK
jgi:hypothetical protein